MARAEITLKREDNVTGELNSVEIFILKGGIVIHRHHLTDDEVKATAFKKYRKFWNKWYTMQELVITLPELKSIFSSLILHPVKAYRIIKLMKGTKQSK